MVNNGCSTGITGCVIEKKPNLTCQRASLDSNKSKRFRSQKVLQAGKSLTVFGFSELNEHSKKQVLLQAFFSYFFWKKRYDDREFLDICNKSFRNVTYLLKFTID